MHVPVYWVITNNEANLAVAPEAAALGIEVPAEIAALAACEWSGWGRIHILVTTRDVRSWLTGEYDLYWDKISAAEAALVESMVLS